MSLRVLVIPEDPTHNGYILRPLVERMLAEVGKPNARIDVLSNPKLEGYDHAVTAIRGQLVERYGHLDLWLFMPDGDRARSLQDLEDQLASRGVLLRCCAAVPEIEAWLLAGHRQHLKPTWSEIRSHPRLKEEVFEPFLRERGDPRAAGGGRERLMERTLNSYRSLLSLCPELEVLETALRRALAT